jgi:hypothetical protein
MFLISPIFSLVALIAIFLLYEGLQLRQLKSPWSDVRSGMFITVAEWAAKRVMAMPEGQERAWKPSLLVPVDSPEALRRSYRFLTALARPNGSAHIMVIYKPKDKEVVSGLKAYEEIFAREGIFARVALIESQQFTPTLQTAMEVTSSAFFRPNILFLTVSEDSDQAKLQALADKAMENELGLLLYVDNPQTLLGREQVINGWIREQSPDWQIGLRLSNLDLSLLLAYKLAHNWQGRINLITVVKAEEDRAGAQHFLDQLIDLGRMPKGTGAIVAVGAMHDFISQAPQGDLNIFGIFGLQPEINVTQMVQLTQITRSTCIFVHDSGNESALACPGSDAFQLCLAPRCIQAFSPPTTMKIIGNTILAIVLLGALAAALFYNQGRRNPLCEPALIVGYPDNQPKAIIARVIDEQGGLPQTDADLDAPDNQRVIVPVDDWAIRSAVMQNSSADFAAIIRDDDPVMNYAIDLDVTWEDGASGIVEWTSWRYGLVSCPLVISKGSGPTGEIRIVALTPAPPPPDETPEATP